MYSKEWLKAALIRALHTVWEALAAMIPAGVVITREMIVGADWKGLALTILGWIATALLAGLTSFIKSMAVGIPEAEKAAAGQEPAQTATDAEQENEECPVTVYAYEDYYEGNPVGEPMHPEHNPEDLE